MKISRFVYTWRRRPVLGVAMAVSSPEIAERPVPFSHRFGFVHSMSVRHRNWYNK